MTPIWPMLSGADRAAVAAAGHRWRPEKHPRHEIVNAIPYVARTGLADRQPLDPRVASDRREIRR
jgi:hypothetical protein